MAVPPDAVQEHSIAERLAALTIRRLANEHGCKPSATKKCAHENHRQAVDLVRHCLETLGLPLVYTEVSEGEREAWARNPATPSRAWSAHEEKETA